MKMVRFILCFCAYDIHIMQFADMLFFVNNYRPPTSYLHIYTEYNTSKCQEICLMFTKNNKDTRHYIFDGLCRLKPKVSSIASFGTFETVRYRKLKWVISLVFPPLFRRKSNEKTARKCSQPY